MPGVGVRCCGGALLLLLVAASQITAAALEKRNVDNQFSLKDKRPFCNAFTGCGRKRSSPPNIGEGSYDTEADTRAELDELARHVLAQARLWEQLQKKVELMRSLASGYPEPAAPSYRRKRAAVDGSRIQRKRMVGPLKRNISSLPATANSKQQEYKSHRNQERKEASGRQHHDTRRAKEEVPTQ